MTSHDELIREAFSVFGAVARPEHFTNHVHCCECAEHDETLRAFDRETIPRAALGHAGWDPMTFATDAGFRYYAPALIRTALTNTGDESYVELLLSQVIRDGPRNSRWLACTPRERSVIAKALSVLLEERLDELAASHDGDRLMQAIEIWSETDETLT